MAKGAGETQKTTTGGGGVTGTYISNRNKKAFRANFDKCILFNPRQIHNEGITPILAPNTGETVPPNWKATTYHETVNTRAFKVGFRTTGF